MLLCPGVQFVTLKKTKFVKEQEASVLLSQLIFRTPSSKFSLLGDIMPETFLRQPGFYV